VCCSACGRIVPRTARQQRFCSARCRGRDKEQRRAEKRSRKGLLGWDTGAPTALPKKTNELNGFRSPKSGSSIGPKVPRRVVEVEIFGGREWKPLTSSDGVACEVSTLRPRALQNGGGR
jgi:hypothetical protein